VNTATYRTQVGVRFVRNAGDSNFTDCRFYSLGNGVNTQSIMNYFVNCAFSSCWKSIVGGDPSGVNFGAGIAVKNCTFVGTGNATVGPDGNATNIGDPRTDTHIHIEGSGNTFWLENIWMEGCLNGIVAGTTDGKGALLSIINAKIASHNNCVQLHTGRQVYLANIIFAGDQKGSQNPAMAPVDLAINPTHAVDGFAAGMISNLRPTTDNEIPTSVFPAYWTYLPRKFDQAKLAGSGIDMFGTTAKPVTFKAFGTDASVGMTFANQGNSGKFNFYNNQNSVVVNADGPGANASLTLAPKGAEAIYMGRNTVAANGLFLQGGATGTKRFIIATNGSDADVNLQLNTRGIGTVQANGVQVETKGHTHTVAQVTGALSWAATVPGTPSAAGTQGQLAADAQFLYVCVTSGAAGAAVWKRLSFETWV
jgi:hypothetical protein